MTHQPDDRAAVAELLASQRRYYDLRAPDYADVTTPADRKCRGLMSSARVRNLVDEFAPSGEVLELACGSGAFTRELVRHVDRLTAIDASPKMLDLNRALVADPTVAYECADLFDWHPEHKYDVVFFGFWLSHVPPIEFERFWALVRDCLRPDGRVGFVDEDTRAQEYEADYTTRSVPSARRTLADGNQFDIIKVFWDPAELEAQIGELGWTASVRSVGTSHLYGTAT